MFQLKIQLPHEERQIQVDDQTSSRLVTDVLRRAGIPLNTRCGHRGLCDGCLVELASGSLRTTGGRTVDADGALQRGCQLLVPASGAASLQLPARSLLAHQPQVVASFRLNVPRAHDPLWQRIELSATDTTGPDGGGALLNLLRDQLDCELPFRWSSGAEPHTLPEEGLMSLVVEHRGDHRAVHVCRDSQAAYGLAVDVGTTTVVVALVDLQNGQVVADASGLNAQTRLGDNVLTRINLCMNEPRLIQRMQQAVVRKTLAPLISDVMRQAGISPDQLHAMVVAGNTTMLHLVLGVDPTSLGTAPFTPVFLEHRVEAAADLSLRVRAPSPPEASDEHPTSSGAESHEPIAMGQNARPSHGDSRVAPEMAVHLLPGAAAYVGADITAGVLASGMAYRDDTCMLVDLGTNGEIVLRHQGQCLGCATAAGPAFEGAGLTHGMRAGEGAISHVWLDGASEVPTVEVIGHGKPIGICGTAYIDFVARARQVGLIGPTARFVDDTHPQLVRHEKHGRSLIVAQQANGDPLLITEGDMASLLQAKAAIAAGVICLLREARVQAQQVQHLFLAGGFGFHMHLDSLLGCGMLPGFCQRQVEAVGNTALAGAYLTLLDSGALREIRNVSSQMHIIELNLAPDFESIYVDQLILP